MSVTREENVKADVLSMFASSEIKNYVESSYFQVLETRSVDRKDDNTYRYEKPLGRSYRGSPGNRFVTRQCLGGTKVVNKNTLVQN